MPSDTSATSFKGPLVAVGASAGGLEPLEDFFAAAPLDKGWCFVVLQHLSADYKSVMDQLLARKSSLEIRHITEGARLAPDVIFLNSPNTIVRLEGDTFRLTPYDADHVLPHLPIDAFFVSMAGRATPPPVAVVLSGSGSDGAKGAAEVHRAGGMVVVQTPRQAKFNSMPLSVLSAGTVDRVLDAAEIPSAIATLMQDVDTTGAEARREPEPEDAKQGILSLLEREHRIDFSSYKSPTVMRRIERRQELRGIESIEAYRKLLSEDSAVLEELYHDMLIGVTEFYRDPEALASLRRNVLSQLVENSRPEDELRLWVAACASGEEAYTLAIELSEVIREQDRDCRFRIIATDVHKRSIQRAAAGIYREGLVAKLPPDLRERYFIEHRDGVMVDPAIRQRVIFSVHDALRDPPFMRLDLISCRNLLIYLDEEAQQRILSMFLFGLRKNGFLYLGSSESLGHKTDDFAVVDSKSRIFRKTSDRRTLDDSMLSGSVPVRSRTPERAQSQQSRPPLTSVDGDQSARRDRDGLLRGYDALLKRYAPSSILVSSSGAVLTWFGAASAYVDTMSNLAEWTVEEIVHPSLRYTINIAAERFRRKDHSSFVREVVVDEGTPQEHRLKIEVEAIGRHGDGGRFLLVTLDRLDGDTKEAAGAAKTVPTDAQMDDNAVLAERVRELERDLRLTEESLQYVTERLEASGEELQASNEELQASNEELQASNEEMQSSNEELQAVNEEMLSVSTEHERKIELLSELNHDTELIFEMLNVGVMVLDAELKVIRFTGLCADMFELQQHDIGRKISNVGGRPEFVRPSDLAEKAMQEAVVQTATGVQTGEGLTLTAVPFGANEGDEGRGVVLIYSGPLMASARARRDSGGDA